MFEQLTQLVQQFGNEAIVKNNAVPNEQTQRVINEVSSSIFSGLQKLVSEGDIKQLSSLFEGNNAQDSSHPTVQKLTEQLTGNLGEKFGLSSAAASGVAGNMIPQILNSLITKAKDPNDKSFNISDFVRGLSSNGAHIPEVMNAISNYGSQFGLDQNADGKVGMEDAIALTKNGSLSGLLKKFFR
jgi:hypothetical protein